MKGGEGRRKGGKKGLREEERVEGDGTEGKEGESEEGMGGR